MQIVLIFLAALGAISFFYYAFAPDSWFPSARPEKAKSLVGYDARLRWCKITYRDLEGVITTRNIKISEVKGWACEDGYLTLDRFYARDTAKQKYRTFLFSGLIELTDLKSGEVFENFHSKDFLNWVYNLGVHSKG